MYVNRYNLKVYIYIYLEIHREKALILGRAIYGGELDSLRTSKKQHVFKQSISRGFPTSKKKTRLDGWATQGPPCLKQVVKPNCSCKVILSAAPEAAQSLGFFKTGLVHWLGIPRSWGFITCFNTKVTVFYVVKTISWTSHFLENCPYHPLNYGDDLAMVNMTLF